ncbi:hypothetical protein KIN20_006821 [Parelaphostrongylus tenuis]|uniref:Uncharacterized protein n=1 Tax=Parelaphostrongylus tenuis TaxID=148309 RepID=A0AAD5QJJ8_PARTN|nr:hypothetical protein KIN20_006821 [Parelaphostrongylus tenuis]
MNTGLIFWTSISSRLSLVNLNPLKSLSSAFPFSRTAYIFGLLDLPEILSFFTLNGYCKHSEEDYGVRWWRWWWCRRCLFQTSTIGDIVRTHAFSDY